MKSISLIVVALLVLSTGNMATADSAVFTRKNFGYLVLATGGWYLKEAFEARGEADKFDDRYKATDPTDRQNREHYDSNRRRYQTRTRVTLALSAGSLLYSAYLICSKEKEELPMPEVGNGLIKAGDASVDLGIDPLEKRIQLVFKKSLGR